MRRVAIDGFDMTLDNHIGLTLYREGKRPAVQGGRFGPSEQMRNPGGVEQAVILDRLDGGVGSSERMVPNTYPLAIDGCTRFSRAWTPSGEIIYLPPLPHHGSGRPPGRIRATATWKGDLIVAAGGVIYRLVEPYLLAVPFGIVYPDEEIQDLLEFNGVLVAGTRLVRPGEPTHGWPGTLWANDGTGWIGSGPAVSPTGPAFRQHLVKSYMVIDEVGAWRLTGNDTPWTFRFLATDDAPTSLDILDDSKWAGAGGVYPVGDRSAPITNMAGSPLVMFFCKTDGVYHIGPDGRSARIADWSGSEHPTNGEVFEFAYGGLYASHNRWGMVRVDVANNQVQWQSNACSPGTNLPRVVPSSGRTTAFCMDGEWMVTSIYNGLDSYIFYARPNEITERVAMINIQSPQSLNWHGSEGTFWGLRITALKQATIGSADRPVLWVALEDGLGQPHLAFVSLPKMGTPLEDWISGGPHRFQPQSWLYYPRQDWGDEKGGPFSGWGSVRKVFNRLDLTGEYLERYRTWVDAYMASEGGSRLFWDRALDPEATLWTHVGRFDEGDRVSLVPGREIQSGLKAGLMLRGFGDREAPFAFYGSKLRGTPLLEQSERRQYRVVFGRARQANQGVDSRERLSLLNEMWALQWADPVPLLDQHRFPLVVDIDPTMSYEDVIEPNTQEPTIVVTFGFRVVRRGFYWGAGYRWGTDVTWS